MAQRWVHHTVGEWMDTGEHAAVALERLAALGRLQPGRLLLHWRETLAIHHAHIFRDGSAVIQPVPGAWTPLDVNGSAPATRLANVVVLEKSDGRPQRPVRLQLQHAREVEHLLPNTVTLELWHASTETVATRYGAERVWFGRGVAEQGGAEPDELEEIAARAASTALSVLQELPEEVLDEYVRRCLAFARGLDP